MFLLCARVVAPGTRVWVKGEPLTLTPLRLLLLFLSSLCSRLVAPGTRVWEVDVPTTQAEKRSMLQAG